MIDRRGFLRAGLFGAAGLIVAGCTREREVPTGVPDSLRDIVREQLLDAEAGLQVFPGALELLAGRTERFPFGLAGADGLPLVAERARVWVAPNDRSPEPAEARYERYGTVLREDDPEGFHVATLRWPAVAGVTDVLIAATAGGRTTYGWAAVQTRGEARVPDLGDDAVVVPTPTRRNLRGVLNLCTREPECGLHAATLPDVLAKKRPVVFTIASPVLCTSRTCGPVLEEVLGLDGEGVNAVHVEPYKGDTATVLSPTARAWRIESEPWTFVIDAAGIVRARFEGPVVAGELRAALQPLL